MLALPSVSSFVPAAAASMRRQAAPEEAAATRPAPPVTSPHLRIDGALNLVVMEFRSPDGRVLHSLPTSRELDAYRDAPRKGSVAEAVDLIG